MQLFDIDIPGKITCTESKTLTAGQTPTVVDTAMQSTVSWFRMGRCGYSYAVNNTDVDTVMQSIVPLWIQLCNQQLCSQHLCPATSSFSHAICPAPQSSSTPKTHL
ncbi:hypothetical protein ACFX2I_002927 [Malus domestica]